MDDYGGRHYPPQAQAPPPSTGRPRHPRYEAAPGQEDYRRRRAHTYRPPPPPSSSSSSSPPPRRPPPRRSPRNHERSPPGEDYYAPRRRRHREEDYFSDDRHNRRAAPRDRRGEHRPEQRPDRDAPTTRDADDARRPARSRTDRPRAERKESKWQKEGKKLFNEYALPAIQAEGTKYISKQIGNMIAKGVSS